MRPPGGHFQPSTLARREGALTTAQTLPETGQQPIRMTQSIITGQF